MRDLFDERWKHAADLAALANLQRIVFGPLLFRQPGHDVSDEPRDEHGRWTEGGGAGDGDGDVLAEGAPAEFDKDAADMRLVGSGIDPSRVLNWRKELEGQLDALEKAGKAGTDEWDKINRTEIALGFYLNASDKDKKAGHASLVEIHDGNNKLYAAVFTQHNPETKVSTIEGIGGIEQAAITKALEHAILHEEAGNKAERMEKVEFADNTFVIDAMKAAGFQEKPMEDKSVVRMVRGLEKTPGEKARDERQTAEHAAMIEGAAKASARLLGYDPKLIAIDMKDYPFKIGGETVTRHAAGLAHLATGVISIFPRNIYSADGAVSVTAHEVAHQKYETVLKALTEERARMNADPEVQAARERPEDPLPSQFREKYPLVARFEKHEGYKAIDKRIATDGITPYSKAYWEQAAPSVDPAQRVSVKSASHETIAEMAARVTETGKLEGAPVWKSYYRDIMKSYDEIKAANK